MSSVLGVEVAADDLSRIIDLVKIRYSPIREGRPEGRRIAQADDIVAIATSRKSSRGLFVSVRRTASFLAGWSLVKWERGPEAINTKASAAPESGGSRSAGR